MENSEKKYGIVNIILMLTFLFKLKNALPGLFKKGESIFTKLMNFAPVIGDGENFWEAIPKAKKEFGDLDEEEKLQIKKHFQENFDWKDEITEEKIERTFNWGLDTADLIIDFK